MAKMLNTALRFFSWTPVVIMFSDTIASVHVSSTEEMSPQVPPNSLCLVRPISHRKHSSTLDHGHVVLVKPPHPTSKPVVRRVIALAGDYVQPQNHTKLEYVPPGFAWLEADRCISTAHHEQHEYNLEYNLQCHGKVPVALIVGRVTNVLPSATPLTILPSTRVFPSANYYGDSVELPRRTTATYNFPSRSS